MPNTDAFNRGQIAPGNPFPERATNTVDKVIATPADNALHRRSGPRYFEDGTSWSPEYLAAFFESVHDTDTGASHESYDAKRAGPGRSRLASGNPSPSWDNLPQPVLDQFEGGSSGDPGSSNPFPHAVRAGFNRETITPLDGLLRGSRDGTVVVKKMAVNPRRHNPADVSTL